MRGATGNSPARAAVRWRSPIFCVASRRRWGPLSLWRADSGPPQIVFAAQYGARLRRGFVDCIPLLSAFRSKREAPTSAVAAGPADYERESLQALKDRLDRNLVIVDVGCRWGFAEAWDQLSPNVTLYGFDPDAEECERLRSLYKGKDVTLVAQALGSRSEERTLYLTPSPPAALFINPTQF